MSLNGSGVFNVNSAGQPVVSGTLITAAAFNAAMTDIAAALSTALYKDGQQLNAANQAMGGFKLTGLAAGSSAGDSVRYEQLAAQVQPITATITGGNAITITPGALLLAFRSTTLTDGVVTLVSGTPAALVIASTDSFGLVTADGNQRIAILAINNAGAIELAASVLRGGVSLDETGVITTATAATLGTHILAAAVRAGVAYRVIGFVDATYTSGTPAWGSITLVQGAGGESTAALTCRLSSYVDVKTSPGRAVGVTYYNTSGRQKRVAISATATANGYGSFLINGVEVCITSQATNNGNDISPIVETIEPGESYRLNQAGTLTLYSWYERN